MEKTKQMLAANQVTPGEFSNKVESSIKKSIETGRPFLVILIQIANMRAFRNQRPSIVVNSLLRELFIAVRKALHSSQYVGVFQDGLGFVFEGIDVGQADVLSRNLVMITHQVIKSGKYNDLSSRWSDIIYQFLSPNKPGIIYPCAGWSTYPRDGTQAQDLVKRALAHLAELRR